MKKTVDYKKSMGKTTNRFVDGNYQDAKLLPFEDLPAGTKIGLLSCKTLRALQKVGKSATMISGSKDITIDGSIYRILGHYNVRGDGGLILDYQGESFDGLAQALGMPVEELEKHVKELEGLGLVETNSS